MTPEQKAAFIQAQTINALAEIEGMKALNKERERNGYALAYDDEAFFKVPQEHGITHNQVCEFFRD